jgi:flagellar assembly factor FliW
MKIKTKPYGEIEVDEKQRLYFPEGIIGFEGNCYYFMLDSREGPFYWLQSEEDAGLAFLLVDPRLFRSDYRLMVRESDLKGIGMEKKSDIIDFAIVTVPEDHSKMSANLMGPIIINRRTKVAKQVISENEEYGVKHYILEEFKKQRDSLLESENACSYTEAK